jgi:hypothetical protein
MLPLIQPITNPDQSFSPNVPGAVLKAVRATIAVVFEDGWAYALIR